MGFILNRSIPKFMKGYPTISDKYNVKGGILEGDYAAEFGTLVKKGSAEGYYKAVNANQTVASASDVAGFILATNVKSVFEWPGDKVKVMPGEAFNLVLGDSFLAVEVDATITLSNIHEGDKVYCTTAGVITNVSTSNIELPARFTGATEERDGMKLAAIQVLWK